MNQPKSLPQVETLISRDGVRLSIAIYRPPGEQRVPALFAASPYRFDNNELPSSPQFLWRETGPIGFYVSQGYAYCHLDLRGCGRSEGRFGFLDRREQDDLYDTIEWIGRQPWCSGQVGSIGQSYYCMVQWFLGALEPPSLKCIGAHDGLADIYRAGAYHGGIPCDFFPGYWWFQNRFINRHPVSGPSRIQETDLGDLLAEHPLLDAFWEERSALPLLDRIRVPLFSSGVWGKMQLHTRGNIDGFAKARGPKKLRMSAAPNAWAAAAEYASEEFHRAVMLPFYDHYLKGLETSWSTRPAVEYFIRGTTEARTSTTWPPHTIRYHRLYLSPARSGSVHSLNDGTLQDSPPGDNGNTEYTYPNPGWVTGVVGFGPGGPAAGFDPARRVLTFTTPPLQSDIDIAGPIRLLLHAASSANDTDFFVKLSDQWPAESGTPAALANPRFEVVSRGWLRASHRALDPQLSTEAVPFHPHDQEEPLIPKMTYEFAISLEPQAYRFAAGHRIRLELCNGDSPATEALWPHFYRPDRIGTDTIFHGPGHPSCLVLPIDNGGILNETGHA